MTKKKKQQTSVPLPEITRTTRASEKKLYAQRHLSNKGVVLTSTSEVYATSLTPVDTSSAASFSQSGLPSPKNNDSTLDNSSGTANMLVNPSESDSQKKGKKKIDT